MRETSRAEPRSLPLKYTTTFAAGDDSALCRPCNFKIISRLR